MLSFIMYFLLKNPEAMRKLREEVDTLIGNRAMTVDDVNKLPYLLGEARSLAERRRVMCNSKRIPRRLSLSSCHARDPPTGPHRAAACDLCLREHGYWRKVRH